MARSPNCCWHIFFSVFTWVSLTAVLLALATPAWLLQKTASDGSACNANVKANYCGSIGPIIACNSKSDPITGADSTCMRWDQRTLGDTAAALAIKGFNTTALGAVVEAFPIIYWRAATGCYATAAIFLFFTGLFSLWNWGCCTKSERPAAGILFLCQLLILAALLLYFGGLGELNDPAVVAVCDCNLPGQVTEFAAFATNPGNCSFGWSGGIGIGSLITTLIATLLASKAKIPDEYYA